MMLKSPELPDCLYLNPPVLIRPANPTPKHSLYLSNLDDQSFLRFSIKYVFLFEKGVSLCKLKHSLAVVLEDYYPFAGRLRVCGGECGGGSSSEFDGKLEVECNGEGAVFAEGFMDLTAEEFLQVADRPNRSWRKLLYRFEALGFLDIPPLVVQVTNLRCGGMILCTGINHCLSDGVGTSQFLHAWAHLTTKPNHPLPIKPFHFRHVFKPRNPLHVTFPHPQYSKTTPTNHLLNLLRSLPLRPVSVAFSAAHILRLKRRCTPSLKCTTFEALAAHTWQSWIHSLAAAVVAPLPPSLSINLLFSVNVRRRMLLPEPPSGFYGNAFVLACAQSSFKDLTAAAAAANIHHGVTLVQQAKAAVTDEYVRSVVDMLDDRSVRTDMSTTLVISQWSKLGLEDLDFGDGKPLHMGPLASDIYCLFLPVVGDLNAVRVLVSVPECVAHKFEFYMKSCCYSDDEDEVRIKNNNGEQNGFI